MKSSTYDRIDSFARTKVFQNNAPGFVMSMKSPDGGIHRMSYGFGDIETGEPVDTKMCFGIASLSKLFTAMGILELSEKGRLTLDGITSQYFPELKNTAFDRITIHHLLSNSSGISTLGYAERSLMNQIKKDDGSQPHSNDQDEDLIDTLKNADNWILSEPGAKFTYLNEGYGLLHMLIERLTGDAYAKYIEDRIFKPLDLENTFFIGRTDLEKHKIATGYSAIEGNVPVPVRPTPPSTGNGGIYSNVEDIGIVLQMLINKGEHKGKRVLGPSIIEKLETGNVKLETVQIGRDGDFSPENQYYGYGLNIDSNFNGHRMLSHAGSVFYYTSFMSYVPELKSYFVAFSNSTNYPPGNIGKYALTSMAGQQPEELDFVSNELILGHLSGVYASYRNSISVEIKNYGSYLELKPNYSKDRTLLIPEQIGEGKSVFYALQGNNKIYAVFTEGSEGNLELNYAGQRLKRLR